MVKLLRNRSRRIDLSETERPGNTKGRAGARGRRRLARARGQTQLAAGAQSPNHPAKRRPLPGSTGMREPPTVVKPPPRPPLTTAAFAGPAAPAILRIGTAFAA